MHFVMAVWFVAIYCPASLSPLFISHGSCTAVNHHRAMVQFPAINSDAGKRDLCIPVPLFSECGCLKCSMYPGVRRYCW